MLYAMAMKIEDVLARRSDLSTFVVHLTRDSYGISARDRLKTILRNRTLVASTPFGQATKKLQDVGRPTDSQRCVCFTETPLEHVSLLTHEIDGRQCRFAPYGIAFTKKQARREGVNPIWYLDITPGHDWLTGPVDALIDSAIAAGGDFDVQPISKLAPLMDQMGSGARAADGVGYRKEFWWEREWRHVGDLSMPDSFLVLCPADEIVAFREIVDGLDVRLHVGYFDPRWSLEQIIASLAGFRTDDVGPM
jgi:hypothetical protein